MFQEPRAFTDLSVAQNLAIAQLPASSQSLLRDGLKPVSRHAVDETAATLLSESGLGCKMEDPVRELSFGQRKVLDFILLLQRGGTLILLDEPFAGIDPQNHAILASLIKGVLSDPKRCLVLASHDLNAVTALADEVVLMDAGRIVERGHPESVLSGKTFEEVYGL